MPATCCIPNCRSNAGYHTKQYVVSFHFPRNEELKREWLKQIPRSNFVPSAHSRVCIKHFSENDLKRHTFEIDSDGEQCTRPMKKVRLAPGAVPTIFKCPKKSKSDTRSDAMLTSPNPQCMFDACRICLTEEKRTELIPLFEDAQSELLFQIRNVSGVTFEKADDIPNGICKKCVDDLHTAHSFRLLCINAEKHFEMNSIRNEINQKVYYAHQMDPADIHEMQETEDDSFSEHGEIKCQLFLDEGNKTSSREHNSLDVETATEDDTPKLGNRQEKEDNPIRVPSSFTAKPPKIVRKKKNQTLICELCGNKFDKTQHFKIHMQRHNEDKQFECEICKKRFYTSSEVVRHMRSHTGEKPFKCDHCDRKFSDVSSRVKHSRTHTNERPFSCDQCGKAFTSSYILKNHMLTHTGEKAFSCDLCNRSFSRVSHLHTHFKSIMHLRNSTRPSE